VEVGHPIPRIRHPPPHVPSNGRLPTVPSFPYGGDLSSLWGLVLMMTEDVLERLRDPARLNEALAQLGLDVETIKLVASLAPSHGVTALNIPVSVNVG
jgi:hypothetical protein